ncbi:MAG TPA: PEP-CTERM sorting domain-containing protein [Candidatus Paceibacterota bacterium]|nr:PEP-CTERM sorting domain-containing protein [Candidatus Paceibacterota bacterium]
MKYPIAAVLFSAGLAVQAQNVISWNVDAYSTIGGASQYAGVVSANYWNNTWDGANNGNGNAVGNPVTWNNLFYNNTGANSGVSVSATSFADGWWNYYSVLGGSRVQDIDGTYNNYLLNGYNNNSFNNITLSSIPYAQYDLYVYFNADTAGRTGTVNVGATTYDFTTLGNAANSGANALLTQTTDTAGANPGADYAVFSGLTGNSQTIAAAVNGWGGIAGFQIVAVPEPGSLALAGLGGLMVLGFRRHLKK